MRFLQYRPLNMSYLQIIKEHINVWCFVTYINIQISILIDGHICFGMGSINAASTYLLRAAAAAYKIKLFIVEYPVNICFWFGGITAWLFKNCVVPGVNTLLLVISVIVFFPPTTPEKEPAKAVSKSGKGLTGVPGLLALTHQLLPSN